MQKNKLFLEEKTKVKIELALANFINKKLYEKHLIDQRTFRHLETVLLGEEQKRR